MPQEKDSAFRRFLENPDCFCDLFNGALFQGEQVLERKGRLEDTGMRSEKHPGSCSMPFTVWKGRRRAITPCL